MQLGLWTDLAISAERAMRFEFDGQTLGSGADGLEIGVKGFRGDPTADDSQPTQVFIEVYKGKLSVHVWDGSSQDPQSIHVKPLEK
jgi:hypothetical protein